jgi:hypothetical protein
MTLTRERNAGRSKRAFVAVAPGTIWRLRLEARGQSSDVCRVARIERDRVVSIANGICNIWQSSQDPLGGGIVERVTRRGVVDTVSL